MRLSEHAPEIGEAWLSNYFDRQQFHEEIFPGPNVTYNGITYNVGSLGGERYDDFTGGIYPPSDPDDADTIYSHSWRRWTGSWNAKRMPSFDYYVEIVVLVPPMNDESSVGIEGRVQTAPAPDYASTDNRVGFQWHPTALASGPFATDVPGFLEIQPFGQGMVNAGYFIPIATPVVPTDVATVHVLRGEFYGNNLLVYLDGVNYGSFPIDPSRITDNGYVGYFRNDATDISDGNYGPGIRLLSIEAGPLDPLPTIPQTPTILFYDTFDGEAGGSVQYTRALVGSKSVYADGSSLYDFQLSGDGSAGLYGQTSSNLLCSPGNVTAPAFASEWSFIIPDKSTNNFQVDMVFTDTPDISASLNCVNLGMVVELYDDGSAVEYRAKIVGPDGSGGEMLLDFSAWSNTTGFRGVEHVLRMEWAANSHKFYMDGILFHSYLADAYVPDSPKIFIRNLTEFGAAYPSILFTSLKITS